MQITFETMKTIFDLEYEIELCRLIRINRNSTEREVKLAKKRQEFTRECLDYLKTEPREEYIRKQLIMPIAKDQEERLLYILRDGD